MIRKYNIGVLTVASLMEDLITVLSAETVLYEQLLPIAEQKTRIIVENDLEKLEKITAEEQTFVDKVTVLEKKRMEIMFNIGTVINRNPEHLKIKDIIKFLERQPKEQKELSMLHDKLKQTVEKLMEANSRNKTLILQSLEMVEFNMNFVQSTRMAPGNNNYTKMATSMVDGSGMQMRTFDRQR